MHAAWFAKHCARPRQPSQPAAPKQELAAVDAPLQHKMVRWCRDSAPGMAGTAEPGMSMASAAEADQAAEEGPVQWHQPDAEHPRRFKQDVADVNAAASPSAAR